MSARRRSSFDNFPTAEPEQHQAHAYSRYASDGRRPADDGRMRGAHAAGGHAAPGSYAPVPDHAQAAGAYSRGATQADYSRARAKKKRKKVAAGIAAALAAFILVGAGAAFAYMGILNGKLSGNLAEDIWGVLADSPAASEPFYALLMGVDRSQERANSDEYAGDTFRSDSMILARIDPKEKQVTLVSLHRDTMIDMGENGIQKLNAAHAIGGPAYTIEVVSEFAGVPISHYAEIDFDGFKTIVDSLGGVEVDVPMEIDDEMAGGYVPAGPQTLNGEQALILSRSRHAYDDYGDGDAYRAANQRMVIGAIAKKLLASDPATIATTVTALCDYVSTDMKVGDIVAVANSLRGMDPSKVYSTMNPTTSLNQDGIWYEVNNNEAWKAMMQRVDKGLPPTIDAADSANNGGVTDGTLSSDYIAQATKESMGNPGYAGSGSLASSASIDVRNGSGISGAASVASARLESAGFSVASTGDADSFDYGTTLIVYEDDSQASLAQELADALGAGTIMKNDGSFNFSGSFLVILGTDF